MLKLNNLSPSGKKRKRIGRGGSRGGTSGRGHKGQNARSGGGVGPVREGGQMPLVRRLPKRGFNNARFRKDYTVLNVDRLSNIFDDGDVITKQILIDKGIVAKTDLVKILGHGELDKKFIIHADAFSKSAREAIISKGGETHITQEM